MERELSPKGIQDRSLVTTFLKDKNIDIELVENFEERNLLCQLFLMNKI